MKGQLHVTCGFTVGCSSRRVFQQRPRLEELYGCAEYHTADQRESGILGR